MDPARYERAAEVFLAVVRWRPEHRAAVLEVLSDGDAALEADVRSLLGFHEPAASGEPWTAGPAEGPAAIATVLDELEPIAATLGDLGARGEAHGAVDRAHVDGARLRERDGDALDVVELTSAPEQIITTLGPVGPWTDVYLLARLVVERVVGAAVGAETAAAALARARDGAAAPLPAAYQVAVAEPVAAVLARALAVRPLDRYQDVRRFWSALRAAVAASAPVTGLAPAARRWRRPAWIAAMLVAGMVVAAALLLR